MGIEHTNMVLQGRLVNTQLSETKIKAFAKGPRTLATRLNRPPVSNTWGDPSFYQQ